MLHILAVGKLKESYAREACEEYIKRLSPYLKITLTEIPETPFRDTNDREKIQNAEAEKIRKQLKKDTFIIALHPNAKPLDSIAFSKKLKNPSTKKRADDTDDDIHDRTLLGIGIHDF